MAEFQSIRLTGRITTAAEARYLTRMAGLPLFLGGCAGLLAALAVGSVSFVLATAAASLILIVLAFLLRGGAVWPVPVAFAVSLLWLGWLFSKFGLALGFLFVSGLVLIPQALIWIVAVVLQCAVVTVFAVSGLRGWIWLVRHPPWAAPDHADTA